MMWDLMATECTQEAVLGFLSERGGRVKNADLINHFRSFVCSDSERKAAAKEAFKRSVDSVAVVKVENGEKYVCLRKRFRGSVKKRDDHHGPDLAAVLDANTDIPPESKDAEQEIPLGSVCAGAEAHTPSNTSDAHKSEDKTIMGNRLDIGNTEGSVGILSKSHDARTTGGCAPEIAVPEPVHRPASDRSACLPTLTYAPSDSRADRSHTDRSERTAEAGTGSGAEGTPKGSRNSFIAHMMNSSPQVRRSMVLKQSRHADRTNGDAEEESGAVTLDSLEHEWMMRACDGDWDSLRRLLDREPGLVSKRDFVTGFTCMHWAAKLGKHELLAQIVNFARQRGVALDVNTRSSAGYTPLHLAAAHNHVEVIKLLVGACDADVEVRDYGGKKASQYLRGDVARDILDIAGAEAALETESSELGLGDESPRWKLPRVLQANLRLLHRSASEDDHHDGVGGFARDAPLRRKASLNKAKPRPSKARAGITAPIAHSTSHFERLEGAAGQTTESVITRPKSGLFG